MKSICVGIDLGGTFIKFGVLDRDNHGGEVMQLPTPSSGDAVVETMVAGTEQVLQAGGWTLDDVACVGIGSPGPLDIHAGVILSAPNLKSLDGFPIRDRLSDALRLPTVLENDANAAAMGEFLLGAGEGCRKMVMLTLGTGVGSGIVYNGRLIHGAHGMGGELGHMIVSPGGRQCNCGQQGCLEQYCSAHFLAKHAMERLAESDIESSLRAVLQNKPALDAKDIEDAAMAGDAFAVQVWDELARMLAIGCINICRIFDPERIVLAGGMTKAGQALLDPIQRHWSSMDWTMCDRATELSIAKLGSDAGAFGAAGVAWQSLEDNDDEPM